LKCKKYDDMRKKYIKPYYWKKPSTFKLVQLLSACNIKLVQLLSVCNIKLVQLLSVCNIKELNNLGKFLYSAEKVRNCLT
jgi:hypothetical protein